MPLGASDDGGSLLHNKPFDYVMARPECTDLRARYSLLSGDFPALAKGGSRYLMVESFGFWGRKFCIKNVEILSVGKIAEFAKFAGGKRRKSPDLISLYERSELLGRGPTESLRALGADADKDINLSVSVRWGLDGRLLWLS